MVGTGRPMRACHLVRFARHVVGTGLCGACLLLGCATAPVTDAYFNLYFAAMGQGRTRTPAELIDMAREAGFSRHRQVPTRNPLITSVLIFEL